MKHYQITHPRGGSNTSDLNLAAVTWYLEHGYTVTYVGPSHVRIVSEPAADVRNGSIRP